MAELSKFYQVTNQIMLEYIANQYDDTSETPNEKEVNYTIYTGKDGNAYYTEKPQDIDDRYSNGQYFIKFPDESQSEYTFVGLEKNDKQYKVLDSSTKKLVYTGIKSDKAYTYDNNDLLNFKDNTEAYENHTGKMHYDKIRLHFIYGFTLDRLAGISLQVKTNARYLAPQQKYYPNSNSYKMFDENNNPVFETQHVYVDNNEEIIKNKPVVLQSAYANNNINDIEVEKLVYDYTDFYLLDIFFPKECLILHNVVKWHKTPIYQNGRFYDRYIEFLVPSAYYMSLNTQPYSVESPYGHGQIITEYEYIEGSKKPVAWYGKVPSKINTLDSEGNIQSDNKRILDYQILEDPTLIVNFATVSEENLTSVDPQIYSSKFHQDPINTITLKYKSNSDYFNVRLYEDTDNKEIVYYPVYGEGNKAKELTPDIMNRIENGEIPLVSEGFYDNLTNSDIDSFVQTYGQDAYKWVIYNEVSVTYKYRQITRILEVHDEDDTIDVMESFTNIIDYGKHDFNVEGSFWKCNFTPKLKIQNNMVCNSISISYTCRLINRLTSVEAIRTATMTIPYEQVQLYMSPKSIINNIVTYKVVNQIKKDSVQQTVKYKESQPKIIRSYYDATNITIKDMNDSNLYTQGQMTLKLKHSSTNYVFRLFNLNEDNIRIPYDLTGPFRYYLVFPSNDGNKIKIKPNGDSNALNLGIGQIVFYISEENVKRIMNVSSTDRYFAIVTDSDNNDSNQSTLYEGKVEYYS